ncbi:Predicted arabinose efflux permease, MFS family [Pedococcus dokdonensis]|uniref:Predicted arabinose efflux permease, MFS family n=1 Tax=Pedococcus dokdonensis TaxID=443156 RepID=A0A1H0SEV8_9MICO|nr:Predicted arabinose efflux permease, MFS family [Pedococcus dokdonensis]
MQRRTITTLIGTQVLVGVGVSAGAGVGALLAEDVSGSADLAGLGGTFQVLGGALIAIPMAHVMAARGRRWGLLVGYVVGIVGAVLMITAGAVRSFPLLLVGAALFGGSNAANSQARYAAADLADDAHRGRDLSTVVWATTIGAVFGPNLAGPGEPVADWLGIPALTGPYVFSLLGLVLGAVLLFTRLRPDPLLLARERAAASAVGPMEVQHGSIVRGWRTLLAHPGALLGLVTMALGHTVMVSVMVMTPLHMHHGGASLRVIGVVISLHVLGMFAFSPLTGLAVDRWGGRTCGLAGAVILVVAGVLAAQAPIGWSAGLAIGLFLLGLGWSFTLVSGSTLVVKSVPLGERAGAQGASDLVMGLAAGGGGALAGVVVGQLGYSVLGACSAVLAAIVALASLLIRVEPPAPDDTAAPRPSVTPDTVLSEAVLPDRDGDQVG